MAGEPPLDEFFNYMGESFPRIMDRLGLPHTLWQPFREISQNNIEHIKLSPAVKPLLTRLAAYKVKLAILTGKDSQRTHNILKYFALDHFFDCVVASDQLRYPKPNPEGILRILNTLHTPAVQAVMIGDAVSDILCAQQAGVRAIGVTWGMKPERIQTLCRPDYLVHEWATLETLLLDLLIAPEVGLTAPQLLIGASA